jgi:predicted lipoprotein with Yx(FWY)xxD motif
LKSRPIIGATVFAGLLLVAAGCGGSSNSSTTATTAATTPATAATTPATAAPTTAAPSTAGATLSVATNAKVGQSILVDGNGKTVYMYVPDGNSTTTKVPTSIKANWPAVTITGPPKAGTGVDASKLAVQTQADGTQQVSYAGHLLYNFSGDSAAGTANGQGLGSVWYVLSPAGNQIS